MRFDDRVTGTLSTYATKAKKIHIEVDPAEVNKNVKVDVALMGDLSEVRELLLPRISGRDGSAWLKTIEASKGEVAVRDIKNLPDSGHLYAAHVINDIWRITGGNAIVATDVDENMLRKVASARYGLRSVNEVPEEYRDKYLIEDGEEYVVRRRTSTLVQTLHLNLHDRAEMRAMRGFDFIFCRNVLIYFDDLSRKAVVDHFYNALNPGGYIFLGHSESIGRISTAFQLRRFENHLVYAKE